MNNLKQKNSKKQGDVGLGLAIAYFTSKGFTVSIPLTDSQGYDLVVEEEGILKKVQVRTTNKKATDSGAIALDLRTLGGNRSFHTIKNFDSTTVDYIFAVTSEKQYLIPSKILQVKTGISLGEKYKEYIIF